MNDFELYKRLNFVLAMQEAPCWVCGTPTRYIEINFEAPTCPGICDWAASEAYWMALGGLDPWRNAGDSPSESSNISPTRDLTTSTAGLT